MLSLIRSVLPEDLSQVAEINNQYLGKGSMQLDAVTAEDFLTFLPTPASRYAMVVYEAKAGIIGYALVKPYSPRRGYRHAGETSVYLRPGATGRGHGRALMELIMERAGELGYRHLTAKIWTENQGSINFHHQLGFTTVGIQHGIGYVNERSVDVTILQISLPGE